MLEFCHESKELILLLWIYLFHIFNVFISGVIYLFFNIWMEFFINILIDVLFFLWSYNVSVQWVCCQLFMIFKSKICRYNWNFRIFLLDGNQLFWHIHNHCYNTMPNNKFKYLKMALNSINYLYPWCVPAHSETDAEVVRAFVMCKRIWQTAENHRISKICF